MPSLKDLTGETFGRLTVVRRVGTNDYKKPTWLCKFNCGNETVVPSSSLIRGATKSCGCLHEERMKTGNKKHGLRYSRLYKIWIGLFQRTENVNNPNYELYGGRGITVCEEWKKDFMSFYNWALENGYQDNLTLDRKDNDGGYEPSNCRWATQKEQCNNTRRTHKLTMDGKTKSIKEWEEETGISSTLITARIYKLGWSVERALTTPVKKQRRKTP